MIVGRSIFPRAFVLGSLYGILLLVGCAVEKTSENVHVYRHSVWHPIAILSAGVVLVSLWMIVRFRLKRRLHPLDKLASIFVPVLCIALALPLLSYRLEVGEDGVQKRSGFVGERKVGFSDWDQVQSMEFVLVDRPTRLREGNRKKQRQYLLFHLKDGSQFRIAAHGELSELYLPHLRGLAREHGIVIDD